MRLKKAKAVAAKFAQIDQQTYTVAYCPDHDSPDPHRRYVVYPESDPFRNWVTTPHFYIDPAGRETPAHHHVYQDGFGGKSFVGRKRDCPLCHPRKSKGAK